MTQLLRGKSTFAFVAPLVVKPAAPSAFIIHPSFLTPVPQYPSTPTFHRLASEYVISCVPLSVSLHLLNVGLRLLIARLQPTLCPVASHSMSSCVSLYVRLHLPYVRLH